MLLKAASFIGPLLSFKNFLMLKNCSYFLLIPFSLCNLPKVQSIFGDQLSKELTKAGNVQCPMPNGHGRNKGRAGAPENVDSPHEVVEGVGVALVAWTRSRGGSGRGREPAQVQVQVVFYATQAATTTRRVSSRLRVAVLERWPELSSPLSHAHIIYLEQTRTQRTSAIAFKVFASWQNQCWPSAVAPAMLLLGCDCCCCSCCPKILRSWSPDSLLSGQWFMVY